MISDIETQLKRVNEKFAINTTFQAKSHRFELYPEDPELASK
jgi:hypothetical protein